MSASAPTVMVSSTFYDLNQVRADLVEFLEHQIGYNVLAFERNTFPIDPDATTIENCRRRVERDADILVLMIGGRYGYIDEESQKSVTNLEYLAARAKRIPIFVFIEKASLSHYESWRKNPDNSYSGLIDNPKLFDFIKTIREEHKVWTNGFERAQEIVASLCTQFAHLMKSSLIEQLSLQNHPQASKLSKLRGVAYRIALEMPAGWEYRLCSQLLRDFLEEYADKRREYELGYCLGSGFKMTTANLDWLSAKIADLSQAGRQLCDLVIISLKDGFGPPGQSGDVHKIHFATRRIADIYCFAIEWAQEIRRAHFPVAMHEVKEAAAKFSVDFIHKIDQISMQLAEFCSKIDYAILSGEKLDVQINLNLEAPACDEFNRALQIALERIERGERD